ncbi:LysR family transcriptional regulator [Streptomyces liangshanensis]|uniref:LysR family transcriptional regulator n=1 Tax=Streptomyces liangshanensis TaxID=2717324 RepID=UPI0036DB782F
MDLRRLGYFAVLAEELNFTRAARRLHIAQPALSQQIQALERQVGARLVLRESKGCSLTPVGVVVAEEAGRLLRQAEAAERRIQAAVRGRAGRLRLAYTRSARGGVVDALVSEFRTRYGDVELSVQTGWTAHNVAELRAGRLDAAFVRPPIDEAPELRYLVLSEEELLLALPAGHALAALRTRISRERIADEPVILFPRENGPGMHDLITRQVWPGGPRIVREEPDDEQLLLAVAAGHGISAVPAGRAHALRLPGVRLRHLTAPVPTVPLALAYHPGADLRVVNLLLPLAGGAAAAAGGDGAPGPIGAGQSPRATDRPG